MVKLNKEELPKLFESAKELVARGIYALYLVEEPKYKYLLVTDNRDTYPLNEEGEVVEGLGKIQPEDVTLRDWVHFSLEGAVVPDWSKKG